MEPRAPDDPLTPNGPPPDPSNIDAPDDRLFAHARGPLARNVYKVLTGNVAGNGLSFLAILALTRTMDVASFGLFTTLQAPMNLMAQLSDFGLNTTVIKHYREWAGRGRPEEAEVLLRRSLVLRSTFIFFVAGAAFMAAGPICARLLDIPQAAGLFRLICLGAVGAALWSWCQAAMQARLEFGRYAVLTTANHALRLVLIVLLVAGGWLTLRRAVGVIVLAPLVGVGAAVACWPALFWRARMEPRVLRERLQAMLRFSRWVFLSAVLTTIVMRLDVLMLARLGGSWEVAQFGNAFNFAQIVPLLAYALSTVLLPKLASTRRRDELLRLRALTRRAAPPLALGGIAAAAAAHFLIPLLLGDAYRPSVWVFDLLIVGYLVSVPLLPLSFCCYGFDKAHWLTWMNAAQLALDFALNLWLIPRWGALGAAMTSTLVRLFALVFLAVVFSRLLKLADRSTRPG